jgi:hypothetical protein
MLALEGKRFPFHTFQVTDIQLYQTLKNILSLPVTHRRSPTFIKKRNIRVTDGYNFLQTYPVAISGFIFLERKKRESGSRQ